MQHAHTHILTDTVLNGVSLTCSENKWLQSGRIFALNLMPVFSRRNIKNVQTYVLWQHSHFSSCWICRWMHLMVLQGILHVCECVFFFACLYFTNGSICAMLINYQMWEILEAPSFNSHSREMILGIKQRVLLELISIT